jgi:hypothetical protein
VYTESSVGGGMHIATDDWNIDDESLEFCKSQITTRDEQLCYIALKNLTECQRATALALFEGYISDNV